MLDRGINVLPHIRCILPCSVSNSNVCFKKSFGKRGMSVHGWMFGSWHSMLAYCWRGGLVHGCIVLHLGQQRLAQNENDHRLPDWKIHFSVHLADIPRLVVLVSNASWMWTYRDIFVLTAYFSLFLKCQMYDYQATCDCPRTSKNHLHCAGLGIFLRTFSSKKPRSRHVKSRVAVKDWLWIGMSCMSYPVSAPKATLCWYSMHLLFLLTMRCFHIVLVVYSGATLSPNSNGRHFQYPFQLCDDDGGQHWSAF